MIIMVRIVGLVGYPLSHSTSPAMHNAAFKSLGLDFEYRLFEVAPDKLKDFVASIRTQEIAGLNVTVPHKERIMAFLEELSEEARFIGAVNTILNKGYKLKGFNTDGEGFLASLQVEGKFDPRGKRAVILGAGGAAKAVTIMLCKAGVKSLVITDFLPDKVGALLSHLRLKCKAEISAYPVGSVQLEMAISNADLLINATPTGMYPKTEESPLKPDIKFSPRALVYDLIYNPLETKLLKAAKEQGCQTMNGLEMLVRQGALSFKIWTGKEPSLDIMRQAVLEALAH